ncbi:tRNA (adenine(22)-N(1))-methyltransferase TrmK [Salibacterium salarium]|uniref:tRNA (Adenine(22)-N(1))-methyltransferase TrmK n=1 Tax=Salibacterium salarium TaxID=284579 RepID=A0A428MXN9_9BACI|nr:tRNA (adenine(22)-N(1))-methyltransferase TrmK [Salibacterium salarium]RSL30907.1 tRNA (adenine(22)-N(1))-methyltransferase TrmK [Salibacterium salarium]
MNNKNLSRRLEAVAQEVPSGAKILDIGTDHGYLPIHLVHVNKIKGAVASDVNHAPLQSAEEKINREQLHQKIETRFGNGLGVIVKDDAIDTVVIAGMGGSLITSILDEGKDALQYVETLILQPNVGAEVIRTWLLENGWTLTNEQILEEDKKVYEILTAEPGNGTAPYSDDIKKREKELFFGPYLMTNQSPAFTKKWQREKKQWESILAELKKAEKNEDVSKKKAVIMEKIKMTEEVIHL